MDLHQTCSEGALSQLGATAQQKSKQCTRDATGVTRSFQLQRSRGHVSPRERRPQKRKDPRCQGAGKASRCSDTTEASERSSLAHPWRARGRISRTWSLRPTDPLRSVLSQPGFCRPDQATRKRTSHSRETKKKKRKENAAATSSPLFRSLSFKKLGRTYKGEKGGMRKGGDERRGKTKIGKKEGARESDCYKEWLNGRRCNFQKKKN